MKKLLHKRWLGLPIGIIAMVMLVLVVTAGSILAAYNFTGIGVNVNVDEPLAVQYKLDWFVHDNENPEGRMDTSGWLDAVGITEIVDAYFSAGDQVTLYFRMNNRANRPLTVNTIVGGQTGKFLYRAFPSVVVPASNGHDFGGGIPDEDAADWTGEGNIIIVRGDIAPGAYSMTFEFTRE